MEFFDNSARSQLLLLSIVGLCGPGMMFALVCLSNSSNSTSDYGDKYAHLKKTVDTSLMATFLVSGVFSLLGCNISYRIGPRWCMLIACVLYALFTVSFILRGYSLVLLQVASVLMGAGAGIFWCVQTTMIITYPSEEMRGRYMAVFFALLNLGGVVGGTIQFITNATSKSRGVSVYTFVTLAAVQIFGAILSLALMPPTQVRRKDMTLVMPHSATGMVAELKQLGRHLYSKWALVLVVPYFTSNAGFAYTANVLCGALFNARTRGFNNIFFSLAKTLGCVVFGLIYDYSSWSRARRIAVSIVLLCLVANGCWLGAWIDQKRLFVDGQVDIVRSGMLDYTQTRLAGPTIGLYTCFGFLASVADTLLMWLISQLSGDYAVTARNVSIFRGFQAFGCAVSWVLIDNVSLVGNCLINWGLVVLCLPPLAYISIAIHRSSEQTDFDVDMQFSDLQADRDSCKFRSEYSTASV